MFYALAVVLVLIADQWLKYWVTLNIELDVGEKALIPGVIKLVNIHNTGAAFGFLKGGDWRWVFVVIAVLFAAAVIYALKKELIRGKLGRWAAVGVLAGAIGNCIDRVAYGYVVDMFKFEFLGSSRLNAIFNIADVFISCCGVLFCLYIIFGGGRERAVEEYEDEEPVKRRSGGSHSKKKAPAKREAAQKSGQRREPVPERTRIPVKEYGARPAGARPARPVEPRQIDPNNPFAEWENQPRRPAQAEPVQQEQPRRAQAQARPEQPQPVSRQRPEPKPQPQRKPVSDTEFSLEDILAEFSDK